jgi:hypothetical protein
MYNFTQKGKEKTQSREFPAALRLALRLGVKLS